MAGNLVMFNKTALVEGVAYGVGQAVRFDENQHYSDLIAGITSDEGVATASVIDNHFAIISHVPAEGYGPEPTPAPELSYGDPSITPAES